jgi:hypothetical protein
MPYGTGKWDAGGAAWGRTMSEKHITDVSKAYHKRGFVASLILHLWWSQITDMSTQVCDNLIIQMCIEFTRQWYVQPKRAWWLLIIDTYWKKHVCDKESS